MEVMVLVDHHNLVISSISGACLVFLGFGISSMTVMHVHERTNIMENITWL